MKIIDPIEILEQYYPPETKAYTILIKHSNLVKEKALAIARCNPQLTLDYELIEKGALLHDIGIFLTKAESIGCNGEAPYVCHGYLGGQILREKGLEELALMSETHTGVGLSKQTIIDQNIPIPPKDYLPQSHEQIIVCMADKFFSKNPTSLEKEKSVEEIIKLVERHNPEDVKKVLHWIDFYNINKLS